MFVKNADIAQTNAALTTIIRFLRCKNLNMIENRGFTVQERTY